MDALAYQRTQDMDRELYDPIFRQKAIRARAQNDEDNQGQFYVDNAAMPLTNFEPPASDIDPAPEFTKAIPGQYARRSPAPSAASRPVPSAQPQYRDFLSPVAPETLAAQGAYQRSQNPAFAKYGGYYSGGKFNAYDAPNATTANDPVQSAPRSATGMTYLDMLQRDQDEQRNRQRERQNLQSLGNNSAGWSVGGPHQSPRSGINSRPLAPWETV